MPGGRPSKYKEEFCDLLIVHMSEGKSFESFAGKIKVSIATLYNWCDQIPQFLEAKKIAEPQSRLFWEQMCIDNMNARDFNTAAWIFNMKNRFAWRDKQDVTTDEQQVRPIFKL